MVVSCEFCEILRNTFFLQNTSGGCFWTLKDLENWATIQIKYFIFEARTVCLPDIQNICITNWFSLTCLVFIWDIFHSKCVVLHNYTDCIQKSVCTKETWITKVGIMVFVFKVFYRSSRPEVFCKKVVLRNFTKFTGKHLCQRLFFNKVNDSFLIKTLFKKESLAQVFSCEFC